MAQNTRTIGTQNNNIQRTRIVKAFQSLNLKDYNKKPSGVWGSVATIKCGNVTIKSTDLDLEFSIPFDDNLESNEGEIIVYNLSDNTKNMLKANSKLSIEAGYTGDTGVIFNGYIKKTHTTREGADKVTTIKVIDDIGEDETINLTFSRGKKASYILKSLLEKTGMAIAKFEVERDWTYDNDVTIDESLKSAIKKYSEVCGVSTFTSNGKIYSCKLSKVVTTGWFDVNEQTGMIGSPSPFEETTTAEDYEDTLKGYEVEMLLQHRMAVGSLVSLKSEQYSGKYYVKSGEHRFNESECITKIKAVS